MRIQHNIAALNSHRNLTNNNSAVSKNLEKLSSGYRINRAGDDAAGLAVSEKMRAQITGLQTAQKNAEDGISLVQTAEGALTEVHSMLNRMVELSTQSANGTYTESNREEMQKEITALTEEVDRISNTANFNGKKLFSQDDAVSSAKGEKSPAALGMTDKTMIDILTKNPAVAAKYDLTPASTVAIEQENSYELAYKDADGKVNSITISLKGAAGKDKGLSYKIGDGDWIESDIKTEYDFDNNTTTQIGALTAAETAQALAEALNKTDLKDTFKVSETGGKITFEAVEAGDIPQELLYINTTTDLAGAASSTKTALNKTADTGIDAYDSIDLTQLKSWSGKDPLGVNGNTTNNLEDATLTIDGQKVAFVNKGELEAAKKAFGSDVLLIESTDNDTALANGDAQNLLNKLEIKLGYKPFEINKTTDTQIDFKAVERPNGNKAASGDGVTVDLHVGETSAEANTISVNIKAMSSASLEIDAVDITSADGAKKAIDTVNAAIDTVSSIRSDLGALQNRLEHTINNLGVQTENITSAEARIRDVDMAKEMMNYTKNNILVQASQAMLAQANQQPQGVLQLLQ